MYEFTNVSYEDVEKMPKGKKKAICYGVGGLLIDKACHKQWSIIEMMKALGVDIDILREELNEAGFYFEDGFPF